ncbi:hypothetical protein CHARACLAT_030871 [Characodon lateralis]|uniref:Uncharacterized protein n=1 Tax=Characodon lateralis TaxID=208331 RepID=A0ABU7DBF8_9TELE|nr:hypothetical protein [Characodon lateralis]
MQTDTFSLQFTSFCGELKLMLSARESLKASLLWSKTTSDGETVQLIISSCRNISGSKAAATVMLPSGQSSWWHLYLLRVGDMWTSRAANECLLSKKTIQDRQKLCRKSKVGLQDPGAKLISLRNPLSKRLNI